MDLPIRKLAVTLGLCALAGCRVPQSSPVPPNASAPAAAERKSGDPAIRNNSLALLADLLGDEKNVSKLLIVKHDSAELDALVKNISRIAGDGAKLLDDLAKNDHNLMPSKLGLPPGERAARQAMSKTKEHELLFSAGVEFEFQLLLTQSDALDYGSHLAQAAADNEPRPELARQFTDLSNQLTQLHKQVLAMLRHSHERQSP